MAEPASAIITLIVFAYNASKSLYEAVDSFQSQRQTIKDVLSDLGALTTVLETIRAKAESSQEAGSLEVLRKPLDCCAKTCQEMHEMLNECTKHSKDGQTSVRLWLKMRWHEKSFDVMKNRLSSYKSTLVIAFQVINIQDHSVTQSSLDDLKNLISGTREDLEDQLEEVQRDIEDAAISVREVLQDEQARLQSILASVEKAQEVLNTTQPKLVIESNKAGDGSRAIFGTDTSQPHFELKVANNEAGVGAVMSAGVHSPETLQALLQQSQTPDLALALQALQTQSSHTANEALQNVLNKMAADRNQTLPDAPRRNLLVNAEDSDFIEGMQFAQRTGSRRGNARADDKVFARPK
ncbi:uncharacterized protein EI97DRAFT_499725, partial [Westerdykella ornata]